MSSKLQQIKAKALAEKMKQVGSSTGNVGHAFLNKVKKRLLFILESSNKHEKVVFLNLSNRGITEMPDIVWNITCLTAEESKELSISIDSNEDDKWWDYVDLTKLVLASNTLRSIPPNISNYKRLHDNCLSDLPSSVEELTCLTKLNISRNQFQILPECSIFLEELDLSDNNLKKLPPCIGFLSRVTSLNLSNNEVRVLPVEIGDLMALKHLDLSKNKLNSLPSLMEMLHHLEQLYIQHNNIKELPTLTNCKSLKEIHAGFNRIEILSTEFLETIPNVTLLDVRDNKITEIPDTICSLQSLERLDISNNGLSSLPYIGYLASLKIPFY
ncbi:leucine-rich repeat-containing protein 40 [Caerostris extrusa]|uniref:Leucine-rich repeat-containing protein 40 n=1 Tax=Caerostris extrusa TaxID=172846 RepID=A0AAV4TQ32_CAEEX|nr:leucine-rich repeat-containing protein 40 [Caerostris extrusa]